jgi:hypothetical protein
MLHTFFMFWLGVLAGAANDEPAPIVPVDLVARELIRAAATDPSEASGASFVIKHATFDDRDARMFSFKSWTKLGGQLLGAYTGTSLAYTGMYSAMLDWPGWAVRSSIIATSVAPVSAAQAMIRFLEAKNLISAGRVKRISQTLRAIKTLATLASAKDGGFPAFSCPEHAWLFRSEVPLPAGWDPTAYMGMCFRAGLSCFSATIGKQGVSSAARYDVLAGGVLGDVYAVLSRPPGVTSTCNFVVRCALRLLRLRPTYDMPALGVALRTADWAYAPSRKSVLLAPTHRSFLDFILMVLLVDGGHFDFGRRAL